MRSTGRRSREGRGSLKRPGGRSRSRRCVGYARPPPERALGAYANRADTAQPGDGASCGPEPAWPRSGHVPVPGRCQCFHAQVPRASCAAQHNWRRAEGASSLRPERPRGLPDRRARWLCLAGGARDRVCSGRPGKDGPPVRAPQHGRDAPVRTRHGTEVAIVDLSGTLAPQFRPKPTSGDAPSVRCGMTTPPPWSGKLRCGVLTPPALDVAWPPGALPNPAVRQHATRVRHAELFSPISAAHWRAFHSAPRTARAMPHVSLSSC